MSLVTSVWAFAEARGGVVNLPLSGQGMTSRVFNQMDQAPVTNHQPKPARKPVPLPIPDPAQGATNPFTGMKSVPLETFRPVYDSGFNRTRINMMALYKAFPDALKAEINPHTIADSLRQIKKTKDIPGNVAAAVWDVYATLPDWNAPVRADEAYQKFPFDNRLSVPVCRELAHRQVSQAIAAQGISRHDFSRAMYHAGMPANDVLKVISNTNSSNTAARFADRRYIAYMLAYLTPGMDDLPPLSMITGSRTAPRPSP